MRKFGIITAVVIAVLAWLAIAPPDAVFEKMLAFERSRHGLEHKTLELDGQVWHYLEGGAENADTIVLVHGFGADKDNWMRFSKNLVAKYHVIVPDLPGWGESARHSDWAYTLPEQVGRLKQFFTVLNLPAFHLAGNSMGGHITALYGAAYPQDVKTLGLFNAAGVKEADLSPLNQAIQKGENPLLASTAEEYGDIIKFVTVEPPFIPYAAKQRLAKRAVSRYESSKQIFQGLISDKRTPLEPMLPLIQTPSLVLWGDTDRALDVSMAAVYGSLLPNNTVVVMENTGHLPMVEHPNESAEIYFNFIGKYK